MLLDYGKLILFLECELVLMLLTVSLLDLSKIWFGDYNELARYSLVLLSFCLRIFLFTSLVCYRFN